MYQCHFTKVIWKDVGKTEMHTLLVQDIELPFPPYLGLEVFSGKFSSGPITSVRWDCDKKAFSVGVSAEIPWEDDDFHLHTAEEIERHFVKRTGWLVFE